MAQDICKNIANPELRKKCEAAAKSGNVKGRNPRPQPKPWEPQYK
jgi:hypothetical protein